MCLFIGPQVFFFVFIHTGWKQEFFLNICILVHISRIYFINLEEKFWHLYAYLDWYNTQIVNSSLWMRYFELKVEYLAVLKMCCVVFPFSLVMLPVYRHVRPTRQVVRLGAKSQCFCGLLLSSHRNMLGCWVIIYKLYGDHNCSWWWCGFMTWPALLWPWIEWGLLAVWMV